MRRLTEPEAHRARAAIIEGEFPQDMRARCAWCRRVETVAQGRFVTVEVPGTGHTQMFRCSSCRKEDEGSAA